MDAAFRRAVAEVRRRGDLYFASLLPEEHILGAFGRARWFWQGWIYTPAVTMWVFLSQCLSADHSCREAVAQLIGWLAVQGRPRCSADTGAYCLARERIPEEACLQLVRDTGRQVEEEAPSAWRWLGRRVLVLDGSNITMPDTKANQAEYPQQGNQKPGLGFPIARIVVVFSLAVGTVLDAAIGKYKGKQTGETSLFRTLARTLREGDVVLADRGFSGWFDIALLLQRGCDVVVRKNRARHTDFRTGQRLGSNDHLVKWPKPKQCPDWMSQEQYDSLPEFLILREVRACVSQKGFRSKQVVVVTTLLDPKECPATEIAQLYRRRWQAELNLRSLKVVLQMDHLRCKMPHRVRNEFYMHLVAYNLVRKVMVMAAAKTGVEPWMISFKGALQTMNHLLPTLLTTIPTEDWCTILLNAIATHRVGDRPDRNEPRERKRRPKAYKLMAEPRSKFKRRVA